MCNCKLLGLIKVIPNPVTLVGCGNKLQHGLLHKLYVIASGMVYKFNQKFVMVSIHQVVGFLKYGWALF